MTAVQNLEQQLVMEGESPELIVRLIEEYLLLDEPETATLYFDYLNENYPAYVDAEHQRIIQLGQVLQENKNPTQSKWQRAFQIALGHDSNASQGTSLQKVDLRLGTGENLVLAVSPKSRVQATAYGQVVSSFSKQMGSDFMIHASLDLVDYQNSLVNDVAFGSVAYSNLDNMVGVYLFDRSSTRFGGVYRGIFSNWRLGLQADSQQRKISVDRLFFGAQDSGDLNIELGAFASKEPSFRWLGLRGRMNAPFRRARLSYIFETAEADVPFDPVFFPDEEDGYVWHAIQFSMPLKVSQSERWDVTLDYHKKNHRIEVNSWDGFDLRLSFTAAL